MAKWNAFFAPDMGYNAVLLAVPLSTRPTQGEIICRFNAAIDATGMDIILCAHPGKDGVKLGYQALDARADNPHIIGFKDSSGGLQRAIGLAARYQGRIRLASGSAWFPR